MGQKTHPVGFRLQINKNWRSTWFTENSFATELESDVKIRKYLKARLPNAGISKVEISRTSKTITITISTARPGIVIGKGGEEVNRLKDEVRQLTNTSSKDGSDTKNVQINISEIKRPELDAALVGANIAHQLKKKVSYRRVVSKVIQSTMRMGADGIRINVAGRLGGSEIARSEKFSEGRVPLHTLRADIDYVLTEAYTQYGIIGVKVWICNGESGK
ncbi:MAG: 30S ribosomal protein S3 [Candidatus Neomarinimicrobiota bacterium]